MSDTSQVLCIQSKEDDRNMLYLGKGNLTIFKPGKQDILMDKSRILGTKKWVHFIYGWTYL